MTSWQKVQCSISPTALRLLIRQKNATKVIEGDAALHLLTAMERRVQKLDIMALKDLLLLIHYSLYHREIWLLLVD